MPSIADRVKETTTTTGTGTVSLGGAVTGFRAFSSAFTTGTVVYYCITDGTNWEVGYGAVTTGTPWTLARSTVLASSNAGSLVSFGAGSKDVFCTAPAATVAGSTTQAFSTAGLTVAGLVDASNASSGQFKFPATQNASADANTLDDYKEAAWTFTDVSGASLTLTGVTGSYTKIGRLVVVRGVVTYPTTASGAVASLSLPYTVGTGYFIGSALTTAGSAAAVCVANSGMATLGFDSSTAVQTTNAQLSGATLYFTVSFFV